MTGPTAPDEQVLESLCRQARALAGSMPGSLSRLTVTAGDHHVEIEWHAGTAAPAPQPVAAHVTTAYQPEVEPAHTGSHAVLAPLVGTFYRASEPGAPPFVSEDDIVEAGQELAIIEAMKIMNRVEADRAGRVVKILPVDGDLVEFGQELIFIEPVDADS